MDARAHRPEALTLDGEAGHSDGVSRNLFRDRELSESNHTAVGCERTFPVVPLPSSYVIENLWPELRVRAAEPA